MWTEFGWTIDDRAHALSQFQAGNHSTDHSTDVDDDGCTEGGLLQTVEPIKHPQKDNEKNVWEFLWILYQISFLRRLYVTDL